MLKTICIIWVCILCVLKWVLRWHKWDKASRIRAIMQKRCHRSCLQSIPVCQGNSTLKHSPALTPPHRCIPRVGLQVDHLSPKTSQIWNDPKPATFWMFDVIASRKFHTSAHVVCCRQNTRDLKSLSKITVPRKSVYWVCEAQMEFCV